MAEETFAERTEQATAKRRTDARKKGQVARSREIPTVMILLAGLSVLFFWGSSMYQQLSLLMVKLFSQIGTLPLDPVSFQSLTWEIFASLAVILAPILLGVSAAAVLSNYIQVGSLFSWEAVQPDFAKINPWKGLGRLFSRQAAAELAKSIFKFAIIGWVASEIMHDRASLLVNIIVAVVGAFLAGYFLSPIFKVGTINDAVNLPTMLVTLLGAIIVIALVHLVRRRV